MRTLNVASFRSPPTSAGAVLPVRPLVKCGWVGDGAPTTWLLGSIRQAPKPQVKTTGAGKVSAAIASNGFTNRGGKKNTGLFFLNNTDGPAILLEVCFVDSVADAEVYGMTFDGIIKSIADVIGGELDGETGEETPPPVEAAPPRIDIEVSGDVIIYVNGEKVA